MSDAESDRQFEIGRGRSANAPQAIPLPGWKDILWRLYESIAEDRIMLTAAGVTYYLLLALVPTLTAFVSIYGLFNDAASVVDQLQLLVGIVPSGGLDLIREQLLRLTAESNNTLGLTLLVSLAIALWSASAGVKAMFEAMNIAYHETEKRNFFVLNAVALLFTLGGAVGAVLMVATLIAMPPQLQFLPGGAGLEWTVRIASYLVLLLVIVVGLAALYRWGPSRQQARWRWITPGALTAVILLGLTSVAFSWYVTNFSDYGKAYGSLGALIGLLTWIWISVTLVIIGAELNSEIEHQTARDSTTGEPAPMGERGAYMADNMGKVIPLDKDKVKTARPQGERPKKLSWGVLAFAVPAALVAGMAQRRKS
jgi:membrane protein